MVLRLLLESSSGVGQIFCNHLWWNGGSKPSYSVGCSLWRTVKAACGGSKASLASSGCQSQAVGNYKVFQTSSLLASPQGLVEVIDSCSCFTALRQTGCSEQSDGVHFEMSKVLTAFLANIDCCMPPRASILVGLQIWIQFSCGWELVPSENLSLWLVSLEG